ncbi:hypothetical protein NEISUBOT_04013 [Neisseria subflava NJ9703]|uniref:Uncharacterized protein n=1 Tax=Neisseria subflava NJ9703 TaxID=546268 RepID=A0A9W5MZU9_NEISU|nr:hypothetical protein NEISUBOT_04013 [Neisseria subflava NJ9703]
MDDKAVSDGLKLPPSKKRGIVNLFWKDEDVFCKFIWNIYPNMF